MFIQALISLRPNCEFTITDEDLSSIVWNTGGTTTPTKKQIDDEIKRLIDLEAKEIVDKEAAKASALAKLEKLGLTADEIKAAFNI
jgi:ATP-dependent protease HslVU (ClpYQ) ATPase subunit